MSSAPSTAPPFAVRIVVWTVAGLTILSGLYLYAVRGHALLVDLEAGLKGMICF
jgi:hypothetical protein